MKSYNIILQSKNQTSLYKFLNFLNKNIYLNFNVLKKSFSKKKRKKVFTILKSPHVNKKAQEQFEIRTYSRQIKLNPVQAIKFLIFLKKVKTYLYTDVNIKLRVSKNAKKSAKFEKKIFNPDNFWQNLSYSTHKNISLKELQFVKKKNYEKQNLITKNKGNKNLLKILELYGKS
jgi:ribosomal protein S10